MPYLLRNDRKKSKNNNFSFVYNTFLCFLVRIERKGQKEKASFSIVCASSDIAGIELIIDGLLN